MEEVDLLEKLILSKLNLQDAVLSPEYYYASLPLCVIDSVFSPGVTYSRDSPKNPVKNWCANQNWERYRPINTPPRAVNEAHTIYAFIGLMEKLKGNDFALLAAEKGFNNRQRTSSRNGELKAKAVYNFAQILYEEEINTLGDTLKIKNYERLENRICAVKGQGSGITLKYFLMLAGDEDFVKADRMLCRFASRAFALPQPLDSEKTEALMNKVYNTKLKKKFPKLTLRMLDHSIWGYERNRGKMGCV